MDCWQKKSSGTFLSHCSCHLNIVNVAPQKYIGGGHHVHQLCLLSSVLTDIGPCVTYCTYFSSSLVVFVHIVQSYLDLAVWCTYVHIHSLHGNKRLVALGPNGPF